MSGSTALEYGFPSTHSTNAVSVAFYALRLLASNASLLPKTKVALQLLFYLYAFSIVLGRLYCGMHGFFDVIIGSVLGAGLSLIQCVYGDSIDDFIHAATQSQILIVVLVILVLIRIHPEPADDCPCFDDSVSFAGVVIGVEVGCWHLSGRARAPSSPVSSTVPADLGSMGHTVIVGRIAVGVLTIFLWRGIMKPSLLRVLPPIFRVIEKLGLTFPRKFFKQASEYTDIPKLRQDDNVIPAISEIPSLLDSIRHPRKRAVSIGPQSPADVYETLAYREKRRRESLSENSKTKSGYPLEIRTESRSTGCSRPDNTVLNGSAFHHESKGSRLKAFESMMGTGFNYGTSEDAVESPLAELSERELCEPMDERQGKEMLSRLEKPRVRYDVEVVTKLIVYTGKPSLSACLLLRASI